MKIASWISNGCCLGLVVIACNPSYFHKLLGIQFQDVVSALIITFMSILILAAFLNSMKKPS